ncbi:uncharacterized protein LOC141606894 [Silene latifolia]|uniref:uncharacterized protein LOC141606894 n=1 Tax=Silene latifolia TaxID=37657 RepID=UPI003D7821B4
MGGDKRGPKSGRYVGGFLQLFDWNAKSRKKLFPSKSDLPEQPKQGKKCEGNLPVTRMHVVEDEEFGGGLSYRCGSEYSYASSFTDDDIYGTKAPGVVARLMGLDSMPTSNIGDSYPNSFSDTQSLQDAPYRGRNLDFYHDQQVMHSSHQFDKVESARPPRVPIRPIEKFQSEILPPKSAKTIPITHHKLLSPIKRSMFVPSRDAAHVMEAAAKIIEPGPQATPRAKISSPGTSSVPFKVREMREKLKASQRPGHINRQVESNAARCLREQPNINRQVESNAAKCLREQPPNINRQVDSNAANCLREQPNINRQVESNAAKCLREQPNINSQVESNAAKCLREQPNINSQVESNAAKCLREQPMNKSWNGTVEANDSSLSVKGKSKSVSLAIQAKVNVQKREGLTSSSRSLASEEPDDAKSTQSFRNQTSSSKSSNRKSLTQNNSSVLRTNNQKQNCPSNRDKPVSKTLTASSIGKKSVTEDAFRDKGAPRTSSRKSSLHARDGDKGTPYSGSRNVPRKKRSIDGSLNLNKNQVTDNVFAGKHDNPNKSSLSAEKHFTWIEESRRKGMDVVSFTFTAPMTRSLHVAEPLRQLTEKRSDLFNDDRSKTLMNSDITRLSSPGFNGIRGDALSVLLEQKLKELASNLGSPHSFVKSDTSVESAHRAVFSPGSVESVIGKAREKAAQHELESQSIRRIFNFQAGEAVEDYCNNTESKQWNCQLPSPDSILESSTLTESCYSSESLTSCCTEERKPCSSVLATEGVGSSAVQKFRPVGNDMETSDSASSTSFQIIAAKDLMKATTWELEYVKNILCNLELMFKDYVTGRTREILNPCLFDQMEKRRGGLPMKFNELKLERRVLFDCVGECLDLKCQLFVECGFKTWTKGVMNLRRNERVAQEIYKEIEGWRSLGNSNVDELVDKDMSSKYGRWLDFEVDEFMLGVEIEGQILDSLVVELVADLSRSKLPSFQ